MPSPFASNTNTSGVPPSTDRKSTRLNSSHTVIYTLSLHDALPIFPLRYGIGERFFYPNGFLNAFTLRIEHEHFRRAAEHRSEEHTSELQSHSDLHSFPTRRSSDLSPSVWHR